MARLVTVKDIALRAGVSIATVSRALNNAENITEEVRQRVLEAAETLGYFSSHTSRNIERPLKKVAFLLYGHTGTNDFFWSRILAGAEMEARKANIQIFFQGILDRSPYQLQAQIHDMRTDGILLVGPSDEETVQAIQKTNVPLVLIDNAFASLKVDAVLSDNYQGSKEITSYLIAQGHHKIAFLNHRRGDPTHTIYTLAWRRKGYCDALAEAGLPIEPELLWEYDFGQPESIQEACQAWLELPTPPSALFCANDLAAFWVIKSLRHFGLRVPEDMSVVGFDNVEMAEHITPPLTTIHVHKEAMGAAGVKALIARAADPTAINETHVLSVDLVIRDSVRSNCPLAETPASSRYGVHPELPSI